MNKSIGLLSALVVTTTFLVNCQKAPDKRRVRVSGKNGVIANNILGEKTKLPSQVCSKEILDIYRGFGGAYNIITRNRIAAETTEVQKKEMQSLLVETLAKCDQILPMLSSLGESQQQGCMKDSGVKSDDNALTKEKMQGWCNHVGNILEKDHDHPNAYSKVAKESAQAKAENDKAHKLVGTKALISDEGLNMAVQGNTNLAQFLVAGEIKNSKVSLDSAMAASQTVCTFLGKGMAANTELDKAVEFLSFEEAQKSDLEELAIDFSGKSTIIGLKLGQNESSVETLLACMNLDANKLSLSALNATFGSVIKIGATLKTVMTTEVVASVEEKKTEEKKTEEKKIEPKKVEEKKVETEKVAEVKTLEIKTAVVEKTKQQIKDEKSESARQKSEAAIVAKKKAQKYADEAAEALKSMYALQANDKASASDKAEAQTKAKLAREAAASAYTEYLELRKQASAAYDEAIAASLETM